MTRLFLRTGGPRVKADPKAKQTPQAELDDSNSFVDPLQPDCRKATVLNGRRVVRAGVLEEAERADREKKIAAARAVADAP